MTTQKKTIETGDVVRIKKQSKNRYVYQVNEKSALLYWNDTETCWWPLKELSIIPQDLFTQVFPTLHEIDHPPVRDVDNDRVITVIEDIWDHLIMFSQTSFCQGNEQEIEDSLANKVHWRWRDRFEKFVTDKEYDIVLDTIVPLVNQLISEALQKQDVLAQPTQT